MFDNKLSISLHKKIKEIFKEKSFIKPHKIKISKTFSPISIKDTKQNIIHFLTKKSRIYNERIFKNKSQRF